MSAELNQIKLKMSQPEMAKYENYLNSFWHLTKDERARVLAKHTGIRRYMYLLSRYMILNAELLMVALQAQPSIFDLPLQIESLEDVLSKAKYDKRYLKFFIS